MIELLYLNTKATMNVPLIPPLSVIETLILSKRFWLKAIFFIWAFLILIEEKGHKIKNKKQIKRKSLRVVTKNFCLEKSNVFLPPTTY